MRGGRGREGRGWVKVRVGREWRGSGRGGVGREWEGGLGCVRGGSAEGG